MNDDQRQKIALFRYGIIAPLVSGTYEASSSNKAFFRDAAKHTYTNTRGEDVSFAATTIERWFYNYQNDGFDALLPKCRNDAGRSRKLDEDMIEQIKYLKKEYPKLPATLIHQKLIDNGTISKRDISLSTVNRYINHLKLTEGLTNNKDIRRYELAHINEVWYADSSVGPYLTVDGKKKKVWMIAAMDDASRLITGIDIFFNDNTINVMSVLKSAVSKFGRPSRLVLDNGPSYKNKQIKLMAARIGTMLQYNRPYTPTGKAKIERLFKTIKSSWMSGLNMKEFSSLEELKVSLMTYINNYNNKIHSSLNGLSPIDRFYNESSLIKRLTENKLQTDFLFELERRVSIDNVVIINDVEYEVHYRYSKQKIKIRFSQDMKTVYLVDRITGELSELRLLNKHENSKITREKVSLTGGQ